MTVRHRDECKSGPPADGVRRVLWWTAKTRPTWNADNVNPVDVFSMHLIGSDGVSRNLSISTDGLCVPIKDFFPDGKQLQPSTTYVGGVEVVLPAAAGTLVLAPPGEIGGWEWPVTS